MQAQEFQQSLQGKKVVVIGASSGIGLAVTRASAALGATVHMGSRSLQKLQEAQSTVSGSTEIYAVDMLEETSVAVFFEKVGAFDHLVVTAVADEVKLRSPFRSMSKEIAQRSLEKFWGSFFITRAAAPLIRQGGSITLTSSIAAFAPPANGGYAVMNAASAAVVSFGRSLAAELKPIRVNVVAPGSVNTGVWGSMSQEQIEKFKQNASSSLPVQHLGEPEELAHAFLYLMTNTYTTGSVLVVDGGAMLS
jgi:NAD(P)-dependent dehydrogenase (short-subunit alcohol dehydrogenase family)